MLSAAWTKEIEKQVAERFCILDSTDPTECQQAEMGGDRLKFANRALSSIAEHHFKNQDLDEATQRFSQAVDVLSDLLEGFCGPLSYNEHNSLERVIDHNSLFVRFSHDMKEDRKPFLWWPKGRSEIEISSVVKNYMSSEFQTDYIDRVLLRLLVEQMIAKEIGPLFERNLQLDLIARSNGQEPPNNMLEFAKEQASFWAVWPTTDRDGIPFVIAFLLALSLPLLSSSEFAISPSILAWAIPFILVALVLSSGWALVGTWKRLWRVSHMRENLRALKKCLSAGMNMLVDYADAPPISVRKINKDVGELSQNGYSVNHTLNALIDNLQSRERFLV